MKFCPLLFVAILFVFPGFSITASAGDMFGARGNLNWGLGKMKNENESIKERTMNTLELNALPGIKLSDFLVGAFLAYRIVGQNTEPSEVSNQNLKGSGYLIGVGATYTFSSFSFLAALSFLGKHNQSIKDISGNEVVFQSPFGFHLGVDYMFSGLLGAGLTFSSVKYKEDKVGSAESDVSNNKRSHWNLALGISAYL